MNVAIMNNWLAVGLVGQVSTYVLTAGKSVNGYIPAC